MAPSITTATACSSLCDLSAALINISSDSRLMASVETIEEAEIFIRTFEMATNTHFICRRSSGSSEEKKNEKALKTAKLRWKYCAQGFDLASDGIPFFVIGFKSFECEHGMDHDERRKEAKKIKNSNQPGQKSRNVLKNTKKMNCSANLTYIEIIRFNEFKVNLEERSVKRRCADISLTINNNRESLIKSATKLIVINFPAISDHNFHTIGSRNIDKRIITKIHDIITNEPSLKAKEVSRLISNYASELQIDGHLPTNRIQPKLKTIKNHIYAAKKKLPHATIDQENIQQLFEKWVRENPGNKFFFEQYTAESAMLIFQSAEQSRLLELYGRENFLIDATYKTMQYILPLFTVCVQGNFGFLPVVHFVTADETTESISKALEIIKDWNPNWNPKYGLADLFDAEIDAVEKVFPGCQMYICPFHCQQAWIRWCRNSANGIRHGQDLVKQHLTKIAWAATGEEFNIEFDKLKNSAYWRENQKLQDYFTNTWLPEKKRWLFADRKESTNISVHTNNGIESHNKLIKHNFRSQHRCLILGSLIKLILDQYVLTVLKDYEDLNAMASDDYRRYDPNLPKWMINRPRWFLKHCMERTVNISINDITQQEAGIFLVKSQTDPDSIYKLNFNNESLNMPSCECLDWQINHLPCEHFMAVFKHFEDWSWDALPHQYTRNNCFNLDRTLVPTNQIESRHCSPKIQKCALNTSKEIDRNNATSPTDDTRSLELAAQKCRNIINELIALTYKSKSQHHLNILESGLLNVMTKFKKHLKDEGISEPPIKRLRVANDKQVQTETSSSPKQPIRVLFDDQTGLNTLQGEDANVITIFPVTSTIQLAHSPVQSDIYYEIC